MYSRLFKSLTLIVECKPINIVSRNFTISTKTSHKTAQLSTRSTNLRPTHRLPPKINFLRHSSTGSSRNTEVPRPYVDPEYSYAFGRSYEVLHYSTISREFARAAESRPDHVAFVFHSEDKTITFRQLNRDVQKLAKALVTKLGVSRGDCVGVFAYNCYNWALIQFACSRIGAILTPINPSYKTDELSHILKTGEVKCLFLPGPKSVQCPLNNHLEVLQSEQIIELDSNKDLKLSKIVIMDSENDYSTDKNSSNFFKLRNCEYITWNELENDGIIFASSHEAEVAGYKEEDACIYDFNCVTPDDTFAIYYTSGTTGKPKGACISQFTAINNCFISQKRLRNGHNENYHIKSCTTLPMFHIFAGLLNTLGPTVGNTTIVYVGHQYDLEAYTKAILKNGANYTSLTPTILIDLLTYVETHRLGSQMPLKMIQPGGAALSPEVFARAMKVLPQVEEIRMGYGSTENGGIATLQTIHEPDKHRSSTVGPPIDFCEVRVVKANSDELLKLGERGEIQTRGYNTMLGYLKQPEKTAEVITPNRWYKTGDLGLMHPHGSIEISGRLKHMIIKGGENIYPEEVSQLIHQLEFVEDVHVVGVPDERFGEQVCAWVKLKPDFVGEDTEPEKKEGKTVITKKEILEHCKKNITYFKVPKYLLFVDEYPMTPTKKVQNHIMTEMSCKILKIKPKL